MWNFIIAICYCFFCLCKWVALGKQRVLCIMRSIKCRKKSAHYTRVNTVCHILYYISLISFALLIWPSQSDIYMYRCIEVHNYSTMYFYTCHLPRLTLYLQLYMIISASSPALYNVQVSFILLQMIYFVLFFLSLSKTTKNKLKRNRWAVR